MEIAKEIKEQIKEVAENKEVVAEGAENKVKEDKTHKSYEVTAEEFMNRLDVNKTGSKELNVETVNGNWEYIYSKDNSKKVKVIAHRVARTLTKRANDTNSEAFFVTGKALFEAGVTINLDEKVADLDASKTIFVVFNPETNENRVYRLGKEMLDFTNERVPGCKGIRHIGNATLK